MKKLHLLFLFSLTVLTARSQTDTVKARQFVSRFADLYNHNKADSIYAMFADTMKKALSPQNTRQVIAQLKGQLGNIVRNDYAAGNQNFTTYKSYLEKPGFLLLVSFDKNYKIIGLRPHKDESSQANNISSPDNISLKTTTGTLYGTLTAPATPDKIPVVLIIAGSGPTDRNCNSSLMGLNTDSYLMLAEALKANGIACLRYDKRGSGRSVAIKNEADLRFNDFINDAAGFIKLLKADSRFSKIIVLGHSEGSLIGMIAANQEKADAFISLSGVGEPVNLLIEKQLKATLPADKYQTAKVILDSLKSRNTVKIIPPELFSLFHSSVQPYMSSWMQYDPRQEIAKLKIPVLILQGTTDLQVSVENAQNLKEAAPQAELKLVDGMNHILKPAPLDRQQNSATYSNPTLPLHPDLTPDISRFIQSLK